MSDSDACAILSDALDGVGSGFLVVVTGAGVSHASGIATFRGTDPGAVWKRDVTELGTNRYFQEDPAGSWSWYTSRFDTVLDKRPNPAHHALVAIERWQVARGGKFLLVTQNVDPLHERAGSKRLVKVHGSADRVRCSRQRCVHGAPRGSLPRADIDTTAFETDPVATNVPRCPSCGSLLRQHVLWFDEFYDEHRDYQWDRVVDAAQAMDTCLFVGTSFSVGVTDLFLRGGLMSGRPLLAIDLGAAAAPHPSVTLFREPAESLLPSICESIGVELERPPDAGRQS